MNKKEKAIQSVVEIFTEIFTLTSAPEFLTAIPKLEKKADLVGFQYAFIGAVYMSIVKELVVPISALEEALKESNAGTVEVADIKRIVIEVISSFDIQSLWEQHTKIETKSSSNLS